jgi:alanine racemase
MSGFLKRTWAEVDLDKINENFAAIRLYVSQGCKVMAIVKADAYGHGALVISKELDKAGADYFGVSNIEEAVQLRRCGIIKPILILGYTPPNLAGELIAQNIIQTVFSSEYALALSNAAVKAGGFIKTHIKIDTGMSRIGFLFHSQADVQTCVQGIISAVKLPGLENEGVFTHFAVSDEPENPITKIQFDRFMSAVKLIEAQGIYFKIKHCCNSAGLLNFPEMQLDMVRPGIILYGLTPAAGMPLPITLKPAMELKTVIFQIKELESGTPVSYGMKFVTEGRRVVGTIPIGYADGFTRTLSNAADVLINGKRARIVGRICMDQCVVDITDIHDVKENGIVTIIGHDGSEQITMEDIAEKTGTINYETACLIGKRVPRVFYKNGVDVGTLNYILP